MDESKELDAEGEELVNALRNLRSEIKALVALETDAKAALVKYLDGYEYGTLEGKPVVKCSTIVKERPDLEALRSIPTYAEVMRAHVVSSEYAKITILC